MLIQIAFFISNSFVNRMVLFNLNYFFALCKCFYSTGAVFHYLHLFTIFLIFPLKYYQSTLITRPHSGSKITATNKKINRWKLCEATKQCLELTNSATDQLYYWQGRISVLRSNIHSSLLPRNRALCCWSHWRSHLTSVIYYIELYDVYDIKK